MEAGAWAMLFLFAGGVIMSVWRWRLNRRCEYLWRAVTLLGGALIYTYIALDADITLARWLVRVLLVALLLPHILRDIEEIGARRNG